MKNLFKKNTVTNDPIDTSLNVIKKHAIQSGVACAINAVAAIATPIAIMVTTNDIEDDYAKKVIYGTGGLLCAYQVVESIRLFGKTKAIMSAYKMMKGFEAEAIEAEGEALIDNFSKEMEETKNEQGEN